MEKHTSRVIIAYVLFMWLTNVGNTYASTTYFLTPSDNKTTAKATHFFRFNVPEKNINQYLNNANVLWGVLVPRWDWAKFLSFSGGSLLFGGLTTAILSSKSPEQQSCLTPLAYESSSNLITSLTVALVMLYKSSFFRPKFMQKAAPWFIAHRNLADVMGKKSKKQNIIAENIAPNVKNKFYTINIPDNMIKFILPAHSIGHTSIPTTK